MSIIEASRVPVAAPEGSALISDLLQEQAGGDELLANRLLFLAGIEIDLLENPDDPRLKELYEMAEDDLRYFQVASGLGRVVRG